MGHHIRHKCMITLQVVNVVQLDQGTSSHYMGKVFHDRLKHRKQGERTTNTLGHQSVRRETRPKDENDWYILRSLTTRDQGETTFRSIIFDTTPFLEMLGDLSPLLMIDSSEIKLPFNQ